MRKLLTALSLTAALVSMPTVALDVPVKGEIKTQVSKHFGEPLKRNPAVGKPPVSSWEYEAFTVYFEKNRVIHTVIKKKD